MRAVALFLFVGLLAAFGGGMAWAEGPEVIARAIPSAPTLDGLANDWTGVSPTKIKVAPAVEGDAKNNSGTIEVELRAGVHGEMIYFLAQWPDSTHDATHKTLHWNAEKDAYDEGKDREDRLALNFDLGGDFSSCMLSGTEHKADVWHWKAYRSQQAGIMHDKMHIMSFTQIPKAKAHKAHNGKEIWIARPDDAGDKLYDSQRPIDNIGDTVPRYLVNKAVSGSIADVKSQAVWADGKWTLEFFRELNTGHDDDVVFVKGKALQGGIAVYDHTGDDHHSTASFVLMIE